MQSLVTTHSKYPLKSDHFGRRDGRVGFTDEAKADTNFHRTDKTFAKYKNVNPFVGKSRSLAARIGKPDESNKQTWVIPKSKEPGPGSYKVEESIERMRWAAIKGSTKTSAPKVCFVDAIKKRFKDVPGAGAYEKVDNYFKVLHKDP